MEPLDRPEHSLSLVSGAPIDATHLDIYNLISKTVETTPSSIAIEAPHFFDLSYAGLYRWMQQIMTFLRCSMEVQRCEVVALALPDGPEMAVMLLGVSSAAICAPLNPACTAGEFEDCFTRLGVKYVVVPRGQKSAAAAAARKCGVTVLYIPVRLPTDKVVKQLHPVFEPPTLRMNYVPPEHGPFDTDAFESIPSIHPDPDDVALVLKTSGTTSRPKTVSLTHANICTAVYLIQESLRLQSTDRCLNMLPQFHIGGLVDLLLVPLASGGTTICAGSFTPERFFHLLNEYRPTWYQAVPTMLHDLIAHVRKNRLAVSSLSLKFIRSVSASLQPALMEELEAVFGVPVIEMYGMTEAGPMICSNLRPPGERQAGSVGKPFVEKLAIMDDKDEVVARGGKGEVVIQGGNVIKSYAGDGEDNGQAFRSGWFHTGDLGHLDAHGYLYLDGRVKETINRGGEKISPLEVEEALLSHAVVAQAVAFPVPHATLGENIAAAVVLHPGSRASERELQTHVASRLVGFKVPYRVRIVEEIPRAATGKVRRLKLAQLLDIGGASEYVASRDDIEDRLARIWARVLKVDRIGVRDNFFELGGHSLFGVELMTEVEREFGCPMPDEALYGLSNVENMARELRTVLTGNGGGAPQAQSRPDELGDETLRRFKAVASACSVPSLAPGSLMLVMNKGGRRAPLYWSFNSPEKEMVGVGTHLGADYPLYGMYAGSEICEYTHTNIRAIANTYTREILSVQPEEPYLVGGNCRGAAVAMEIGRNLFREGKSEVRLCLMEFFHPDLLAYPGELTLLYGKQSPEQFQERFDWGKPGWADRFVQRPTVAILPGRSGYHWTEDVESTSKMLAEFIDGTLLETPAESYSAEPVR